MYLLRALKTQKHQQNSDSFGSGNSDIILLQAFYKPTNYLLNKRSPNSHQLKQVSKIMRQRESATVDPGGQNDSGSAQP